MIVVHRVVGEQHIPQEVNEFVLESYSNRNCKRCYGRGYQRYLDPQNIERLIICECIDRMAVRLRK